MIRNDTTQAWENRELEDRIVAVPRQFRVMRDWLGEDPYIAGRRKGNVDLGELAAGQSAGVIHDVMPAAEIVRRLSEETAAALTRLTPA